METKYNCSDRNFVDFNVRGDEGLVIFKYIGCALGKSIFHELGAEQWSQTHLYVLTNCEDVKPFIK